MSQRRRSRRKNPNRAHSPWTDNKNSGNNGQRRNGNKIKRTFSQSKRVREVQSEIIDDCPATGKRPFATYADAIRLRPGVHQAPYQCPHCKCWHLKTINKKDNT